MGILIFGVDELKTPNLIQRQFAFQAEMRTHQKVKRLPWSIKQTKSK